MSNPMAVGGVEDAELAETIFRGDQALASRIPQDVRPILLDLWKEQRQEIDSLKQEIHTLKQELERVRQEMEHFRQAYDDINPPSAG